MAWWSRTGGLPADVAPKKSVPKGVWTKCDRCSATIYDAELVAANWVCQHCGHHFRLETTRRIALLADEGTWHEHDATLQSQDPLDFRVDGKKYGDLLRASNRKLGQGDAYRAGAASVGDIAVELGVFAFEFMGGSMGSVVGERFVRGVRVAYENRVPFVCISASGGARMQEGVNSLFQMAKTTAALQELAKARLPFVSLLTDPTMGGVSASFAFVADLVIAEPGALIGFAGPRVIEQTVREKLPEGFQRAEFLLEKGAIDMIVDRRSLRDELPRLLALLTRAPAPTS